MQEPFCSLPLIWIIREDTLANRLPMYEQRGWKHLISHWKRSFRRANVVVFPDFALPVSFPFISIILLDVVVIYSKFCVSLSSLLCLCHFLTILDVV